jgi:predicted permease
LSADWRVLLFSFAVAVATSLTFGLLPAWRATRLDLVTQLKEGAGAVGSRASGWLRRGLVSAQIALSLALLVAAGLMTRSARVLQSGTNFDPGHMAVLRVRTELLHYTTQQNEEFFRRIVQRLEALPGVEAVTFVRGGEGLIWNWNHGRDAKVTVAEDEAHPLEVKHHDIGLNFFSTLRTPLLEGREFTEHDGPNSPRVAILNQTLADELWPRSSAVGRSVVVNHQRMQVVGVAANIQPPSFAQPPAPYLFLPFWQSDPGKEGDLRLAIRTKADPIALLPEIRRVVGDIDPNIPIGEDMPMLKQMEAEYMPVMLSRSVISYCGVLALGLSAVGLFSVLSYFVRTRTREIGIRMALGAQINTVLRLIVGQALTMSLAGLGVGLVLALASVRLISSWLYGVQIFDATVYFVAAVLLLVVALAASYVPATRAAHVDPVIALRQD